MIEETTIPGPVGPLNLAVSPESGPPILLLHGVLRCWQDFSVLLPALTARWQVLGLDFRGHGRSGISKSGAYRIANYAGDVHAVLQTRQGAPVVLFGHSLGAMVAFQVAAQAPDRVRAVILEDPPFESMGKDIALTPYMKMFSAYKELLNQGLRGPSLVTALGDVLLPSPSGGDSVPLRELRDAATLRFMGKCLSVVDPLVLDSILDGLWMDGYDVDRLCGVVRCPVLALQGNPRLGGVMTDYRINQCRTRLLDCSVVCFSECGHGIHSTQPAMAARVVTEFIESL